MKKLFSTGQPLNETRFLLRRARLGVRAEYQILSSYLELDANTVQGPVARVSAADVSIRWPPAKSESPVRRVG